LVWLGNPRDERQIKDHEYGVESVRRLIGKSEDIARFDYAMVLAHGDVESNLINRLRIGRNGNNDEFDRIRAANKALILWVWSRTNDQIKFTKAATISVLRIVPVFADNYHPSIPLIQHENFGEKLAKLAAAIAGRTFSTDETGKNLIVRSAHVIYAAGFLQRIYQSNTMGYRLYSQLRSQAERITNPSAVESFFYGLGGKMLPTAAQLLQRREIALRDLSDILDVDGVTGRETLTAMLDLKILKIHDYKAGVYVKTPDAIKWLRQRFHGS